MSAPVYGSPLKISVQMKSEEIEFNFDFEIQVQPNSPDELEYQI
jgi:hypothetical protein